MPCPHCGGLHLGQRFDDCPYIKILKDPAATEEQRTNARSWITFFAPEVAEAGSEPGLLEAAPEKVDSKEITIGQYADYFDTGMWTFRDGGCFAPDDLTIAQLRDHLLACGGFVYLHHTGKFAWANRG